MLKSASASALQGALTQICDGIEVADRSLSLPDGITFDQAEAVGALLFGLEETNRFAIGDFLNGCEEIFREAWTQLLSEKLASRSTTIENWRYTCRNVPPSVRRSELGISAHYYVAKLRSHLLQEQLLRVAVESELSSKDIEGVANLFKEMTFDEQVDWAQRMTKWQISDLVAAYNDYLKSLDLSPAEDAAPDPLLASRSTVESDEDDLPFVLREDPEEAELSGEAGDYDWTEKDDYGPEEEDATEESGDLVALKTALDELYLAADLETYAKRRITFARLLAELDESRSQMFADEVTEEYA